MRGSVNSRGAGPKRTRSRSRAVSGEAGLQTESRVYEGWDFQRLRLVECV